MTRSFGDGPERQKEKQPDLRTGAAPGWQQKLDSLSRYSANEETAITPVRVDMGKRFVAGILDVFAAYIIGAVIELVPIVNDFMILQLSMTLVLLARDWFFDGRGVGKNLMGLQVVDIKTGRPCSLMQSIKRNIIILIAPLILYIITMVLTILHGFKLPWLGHAGSLVLNVVTTVGFVYLLVVVPNEVKRAYQREDGRRFGDQMAGTAIVEAPMDFSTPIPR